MLPPASPLVDQITAAVVETLRSRGVEVEGGAAKKGKKGGKSPVRNAAPNQGAPAAKKAASMKPTEVAAYIDHTLLKPDATPDQVAELCAQARDHKFASVCVNPSNIEQAAGALEGSGVMVCTVVGFPLGAMTTAAKAAETRDAVTLGAEEIDMVINVGRLKARDYHHVLKDIQGVVEAAQGRTVKVIIETSLLTEEEKVAGSLLTKAGGAHFVKTSTGFGGGGATAEDISLMRGTVGDDFGVKASGGVRDLAGARKLLAAGANRLGCSASIAIVTGGKGKQGY